MVVALLVIGGLLAAQQGLFRGDGSTVTTPTVMATAQTASPTAVREPTDGTEPSPSPTVEGDRTAQQALDDCRHSVQATDRILAAARVGIGHWSEHVQAQTDANAGTISQDEMAAIFKRTRLDGPDDVAKYKGAVKAHDVAKASCDAPAGASAPVTEQMSRCSERSRQQKPVATAAQNGMDDWESHLAAMMRSRMGQVHDAQGVWIRAWKAAPPHISAYHRAVRNFDAPAC